MKIKTIIKMTFGVIFMIFGFDYLGFAIFLAKNGEEISRVSLYGTIALICLLSAIVFFHNAWHNKK
ncbi:MAG: hypothetical protein AAB474_01685 [Patescibacteria group bacterium]